jgi:Uma2 family endonuclease
MQDVAQKRATYADLEAVPPHLVAEILDGGLFTHPRPVPRHALISPALLDELVGPFQKGRGGPGGWVFMNEPELHFDEQVLVPDLAAWRRERLPELPETAWIETAPDWVCEILSPSTEKADRCQKRRIYGESGIAHLWLVDPRTRMLETFELVGTRWQVGPTFSDAAEVCAPPFTNHRFSLGVLWPFDLIPTAEA